MRLKAPAGRKRGAKGAPRPAAVGRLLHDYAVGCSRAPRLYSEYGAPDTVEGRFELLTLHVILLLERLRAAGDEGGRLGQALFDTYVGDLDGALREMGVGDLSVGRRMKALAQAFYGRAKASESAFGDLPDTATLEALLARTVATRDPAALARYVVGQRDALADTDVATLLAAAPAGP